MSADASVIADFGQFEDDYANDGASMSGPGLFDPAVAASALPETSPQQFLTTITTMSSNITTSVFEASVSTSVEWGGFDSGTSAGWGGGSMVDVVFETAASAAFTMDVTPDAFASIVSLVDDVSGEEIFYVFDTPEMISGTIRPGRYRLLATFDIADTINGDFQTEGSFDRDHYSFRFEIPAPSTVTLFAVLGLMSGRRR
ncbi:MAG: hypothetical protein ACF8Q5_05930 [Phycisphaerales bacterium JB040]